MLGLFLVIFLRVLGKIHTPETRKDTFGYIKISSQRKSNMINWENL